MTNRVLLIEDDDVLRASLTQTMELAGFEPIPTSSFVQARRTIRSNFNGVVLSDIRMPHQDGFDVLGHVQRTDPDLPVILLTGHSDVPTALRAMKEGAWDYLEKPCSTDRLQEVLTRALHHRALVLKSRQIERSQLRNDPASTTFPGSSEASHTLRTSLRSVAASRQHVHLWGDEGTGKRQAAYVVNRLSTDPTPFLRLDFRTSGAAASHDLQVPEGPFDLSAKRVHEAKPAALRDLIDFAHAHPNLRLITSSTQSLEGLGANPLTDDPEYMEQVVKIRTPTLEERKADLPDVFTMLLRQIIRNLDADMPDIPEGLMAQIMSRPWPGNLPELRSFAMSFALGDGTKADTQTPTLAEQLDAFEKLILIQTLKRAGGRVVEAAELLGIPRNTLYDRISRYELSARDFRTR
ncbi:MAG: response regulator [Pseudomonadota bacterium]